MKCFVHEDEDAVGVCKHCSKAVCKKCAVPNDHNFLVCSEICKQEALLSQEMMERAKMAYGLKPGRLPASIIFLVAGGVLFLVYGCFLTISSDMTYAVFTLLMGLVFLITGGVYYYNQRKSGLRS
jgi:hypothetical protein